MIQWFVKKVLGTKNQREVKRLLPLVEKINALEKEYQGLMDEQLQAKTTQFRERFGRGETLDSMLPEAFAVVKNACRRLTERKHSALIRGQQVLWEMIPFDVQLIGGMVLHSGRIAEMATGEGKTLVATFPAYLNALSGRGVHSRDGERLSRGARQRVDGRDLPLFEFDGRLHSARAGSEFAPRAISMRHHLWDERGDGLRLFARQRHGDLEGGAGAARTHLRDRG